MIYSQFLRIPRDRTREASAEHGTVSLVRLGVHLRYGGDSHIGFSEISCGWLAVTGLSIRGLVLKMTPITLVSFPRHFSTLMDATPSFTWVQACSYGAQEMSWSRDDGVGSEPTAQGINLLSIVDRIQGHHPHEAHADWCVGVLVSMPMQRALFHHSRPGLDKVRHLHAH